MLFALKKLVGYLLMPLPVCLLLLTGGLLLALRERTRRAGWGIALAGLLLLALFSNRQLSRALIRGVETHYPAIPELTQETPPPAELLACRYVVVLGSGHGYSPNTPATSLLSATGVARITEAVRLLRVLPDARLLVTGPAIAERGTHAEILARAAVALGVDRARILKVEDARDTEEEAAAVAALVGGERVALVTSGWHMRRSMALMRDAGVPALACPTDFRAHAPDLWSWHDLVLEVGALERSTLAVRERIGYAWIWMRGKAEGGGI